VGPPDWGIRGGLDPTLSEYTGNEDLIFMLSSSTAINPVGPNQWNICAKNLSLFSAGHYCTLIVKISQFRQLDVLKLVIFNVAYMLHWALCRKNLRI